MNNLVIICKYTQEIDNFVIVLAIFNDFKIKIIFFKIF